jgi:hypothetical protein
VTTKKIHARAVTARKIKPGAVRSVALADGSVGASEIADGSVGAAEIADGSVGALELANNSVAASELVNGAVGTTKLATSSVRTGQIADRSIRLHDLGGTLPDFPDGLVNQTTTTAFEIKLAASDCRSISLTTLNPTPAGILGSMVVGTITTSAGGPVVDNAGFVLPTLVTETSQGGVVLHLAVCAGGSPQTIPAGSIATWSLIAP